MQTLWRAWSAHPGTRTLVFCCSIAHADFVRDWLRSAGRAGRRGLLRRGLGRSRRLARAARARGARRGLRGRRLQRGRRRPVDRPRRDAAADRVERRLPPAARPRPARVPRARRAVTVIDFVGNHRDLPRAPARAARRSAAQPAPRAARVPRRPDEPWSCRRAARSTSSSRRRSCSRGCSASAAPTRSSAPTASSASSAERRGLRPTAGELQRMGYLPSRLRERHGSWFDFVRAESGPRRRRSSRRSTSRRASCASSRSPR